MKNKYLILLFLLSFISFTHSQESILLFNYDEVYPMTSSWADSMEPALNPAPDAVNNSQISGLFIHNAQWSEIEIRTDDSNMDGRFYNTVELKAFIPANMPDGKVSITCKGLGSSRESRRRYDVFEITPPLKGKWFKIQHSFLCAYPIGLIQMGYRRSEVPNPSEDIAYFDDLIFHQSTSNDICLYRESFCIVYPENENADFIGSPTNRAGNWVGNVDLTSTGNIRLVKYLNTTSHVMRMTAGDADIVFPGITNLDGYDNLRVVFDSRWVVDEAKRAAFVAAGNEVKSPAVKAKIGSGNWTNVAVQPVTDSWQTQSILISAESAQNLSLQIGRGSSTFDFEIDNVMIMGTKKSSGLKNVPAEALSLYPNPVKDILYAPTDLSKIEVLSLQGDLMISTAGNAVSFAGLPKGIYIVKSTKNSSNYINKIVKN